MAYDDFLKAFAKAQNIASVDDLLSTYGEKYSFQIKSRERGASVANEIQTSIGIDLAGKNVLDIGCAYGSFSIEFAKLGCHVVGIDVNEKWLQLATANALDEAECEFIKCDASSFVAQTLLKPKAPFDIVVVNDVFEYIYDIAGLLNNLRCLMADDGLLFLRVSNGMATRTVISDRHKKIFGISLLPPDYWSSFVDGPSQIYYRRREFLDAIFKYNGFYLKKNLDVNSDSDRAVTVRAIRSDLSRIKRLVRRDNFENIKQYRLLFEAVRNYIAEVESDIEFAEHDELFRKYRATFWSAVMGFSR